MAKYDPRFDYSDFDPSAHEDEEIFYRNLCWHYRMLDSDKLDKKSAERLVMRDYQ